MKELLLAGELSSTDLEAIVVPHPATARHEGRSRWWVTPVLLLPIIAFAFTHFWLPGTPILLAKKGATAGAATFTLSSGLTMSCLTAGPPPKTTPKAQPFVLFVHGSYHGAWCWAEHWMPYLAARGVHSVAINLRGTAGALPNDPSDSRTIPLRQHVQDLSEVVHHFARRSRRPVLLAGHSFGGLMLLKLLERSEMRALAAARAPAPRLAGLALLCAVPPSGNSGTVRRALWTQPWTTLKIAYGFAANAFLHSASISQAVFFDDAMPAATVQGYLQHFQEDGRYRLDLPSAELPILVANASNGGRAAWVGSGGLSPNRILVLGGENDVIVDQTALEETAEFCGKAMPVVLPGVCHDLMLDSERWEHGVTLLWGWLRGLR